MKNQFTKTPYLVLFIILGAISIGTVSALVTITLAGDVIIEGNTQIDGNLNLDGAHSGIDWNSRVPQENQITTVDGDTIFTLAGRQSSITIGKDGLPVVAYTAGSNEFNQDLKVLKCTNPACSSGNIITTIDSSGTSVGRAPSIAISSDGNPVIVYFDVDNQNLKLAKCGNESCSSGNDIDIIFDSSGTVGHNTSLTMGSDGFPIIGFYDGAANNFKIMDCDDSLCNSNSIVISLSANTGLFSTIATEGFGQGIRTMALYYDSGTSQLKIINIAEGGGDASGGDASLVNQGTFPSFTYGNNFRGIASFHDEPNNDVLVTTCLGASCDTNNIVVIDDIGDGTVASTAISINGLGLPVISYYEPDGTFIITTCRDFDCSVLPTIVRLDETNAIASTPVQTHSMAIGPDGTPVTSYHDASEGSLKIAKCGNPTCIPNWTRK